MLNKLTNLEDLLNSEALHLLQHQFYCVEDILRKKDKQRLFLTIIFLLTKNALTYEAVDETL